MSADVLERAFESTAKVLANLQAGQLDDATPCKSWKVRDLVNHIVGGAEWFGITAETGTAPTGGDDTTERDWTSGNIQASFDTNSKRAVAAFSSPGTLEKTLQLPWGPMPGSAFVMLAATDTFTHAWDLAKATGQSTDLDPEFAAQLLPQVQAAVPDMFRGEEGSGMPFGAKQEAPAGASAADQIAAFLGRTV